MLEKIKKLLHICSYKKKGVLQKHNKRIYYRQCIKCEKVQVSHDYTKTWRTHETSIAE